MKDYISREVAIEAFGEEPEVWTDSEGELATRFQWRVDKNLIETLPAADVRENVHGEWVEIPDECFASIYRCSNCGANPPIEFGEYIFSNFCPNCGCSMKEKKDERNQRN